MRFFSSTILLSLILGFCNLQAQPNTDIYLFSIDQDEGKFSFKNLVKVTDRDGYDNQPYFTPDSRALRFTSIREEGKSDIYKYDIESRETINLTNTPETSQYSAISTPNGEYFSVVMVEENDTTQRLWKFPTEGGEGICVFEDIEPVGYYTWFKEGAAAMFILGEPFTLQIAQNTSGKTKRVAENIGRSIHTIPGTNQVSFVIKEPEEKWTINRWDSETGETALITETLEGSEDYCWHPQGFMIMGKGAELFMHAPLDEGEWESLGDLGIGEFYRVTVSPDGKYLALVKVKE